ncbi:9791_t:CDS:2 [Acaulospora morrowiae]|uniref:9791_t:CDS:1 n=1 Tax=Acaulospora morrowiae TaxID=94023 RepID=A0A9N9F4Z1_9GLOM|nr:9791_t:CDS:2 [Acaulospora morrowiae]
MLCIPKLIGSRSEDAIASEETIIPDPSPEIEHSPTKSESLTELEESEIRCSESPSATSLPQDDTSKQMSENASDISDIASNSGVCHKLKTRKSLKDKVIDEFLEDVHKKKISDEIRQRKHEEKLRDQDLSSVSHKKKGTDKLRQELFNTSLEPSSQDHSISKNIKPGQIEISETARPKKLDSVDGSAKCIVNSFDINEVSQHLAQLCYTAIGAEDRASKANQEEIMCWSLYGRDFEFQVESQISNSPSLEITPEVSSEDNIIEVSESTTISTDSKKLPEMIPEVKPQISNSSTEVSALSEKVSSETKVNIIPINKNSSNESRLPISILPNDPEEKRNLVIHTTLEQFNNLSLKRSNKYSDCYDYSGTCPTCNEEHQGCDVEGR